MQYADYLNMLEKKQSPSVFSSVDENGQAHARFINAGVGNKHGIFFMTSPKNNFYSQLEKNPSVAVTDNVGDDDHFEAIRVSGLARKVDEKYLKEILKDNPYVEQVYPDVEERRQVQAFQIYKGQGSYQDHQENINESFEFNVE